MAVVRLTAKGAGAAAIAAHILDEVESVRDLAVKYPALATSRLTFVGRIPSPTEFRAYLAAALPEGVEIDDCKPMSIVLRLTGPATP